MKDSRQKYLDIATSFNNRATELDLFCKQSQRICERIAKTLVREHPKTPNEFERNEYLKDFVMKTSQVNERTIDLLHHIHIFLQDMLDDYDLVKEGANLRDKLQFQSDTIELLWKYRDQSDLEIYNQKKLEFKNQRDEDSRRNQANS